MSGDTELESVWLDVGGVRMHARTARGPRPDRRPPIILVHGLVVSSRYLSELCQRLGPWFPTWAVDLPGYGKSEDPGRVLSLPELADALVAWMDVAGIASAAWVGQSFGCQIVAHAAARHPERVDRVVLQGPTAEPGSRTLGRQLGRFAINASRDATGMGPIMVRDYVDAGLRRAIETFRMEREDAIEKVAPDVVAPTLVISGGDDPIAPPRWGDQLSELFPDGRHAVLEGSPHTAVYDQPRRMARLVHAFVRDEPIHEWVPDDVDDHPGCVAAFDSASAMLRATAAYLHREDFPGLGVDHPLERALPAVNVLPRKLREQAYSLGGWGEAIPAADVGDVRLEDIDRWIVGRLPDRRQRAVFLGSSNGALVHLYAALEAPWLPQSLLIPVRRFGSDVNDARAAMEWGREPGRRLLEANPDLALHHMHDPNQDHLMSRHMAYFRVKRRRLGRIWESWLRRVLEPGGTLYVVECDQRWPSTRVDDRHWFQTGGVGGLSPEEYLHGSPRVTRFIRERGGRTDGWNAPAPDQDVPEAEWGFDSALLEDTRRFATENGYRVRRIRFDSPDAPSGPVAELYREWYASRGLDAASLLVGSFVLMEPWWCLRAGLVPYWTSFPVEHAAETLERYLDGATPYDDIHAMLFSHGIDSLGLAPIDRWRLILARARRSSGFVGVDTKAFPRDFGVLRRYHTHLPAAVDRRLAMPEPMELDRLDRWLTDTGLSSPERAGAPASAIDREQGHRP